MFTNQICVVLRTVDNGNTIARMFKHSGDSGGCP